MIIDDKTGLVLEGGGMRGVFTAGALDYFMDKNLYFPYTIAVSAGSTNGLSYASHQRGRAKQCNIDLLDQYRYIGVKYLFTQKSIMDFDLLFEDFPSKIIPYDYTTYFSSKDRFVIVTSNCITGKAGYFEEKKDEKRLLEICRASCSLPFLCPVAFVDGVPMLDGGICDPIPVRRAIEDGYNKNVIVLTRNKGYRKSEKKIKLPRFVYKKYPAIREQLQVRNRHYNETMDFIERLETEGKALVIRPEEILTVDRMEKDVQKLTDLYLQGYSCAQKVLEHVICAG